MLENNLPRNKFQNYENSNKNSIEDYNILKNNNNMQN